MKVFFNDKCSSEEKYSNCYIEEQNGSLWVVADLKSGKHSYCPFDNPVKLVVDYLSIGYKAEHGIDPSDSVLEFVKEYGFMSRNDKRLNISDFAEDAQMLYLHFAEAEAIPYPENPEFVLETDAISAVIMISQDGKYINWQTQGLSSAIELAYTLLLCSDEKAIGICKHCGMPYYSKNPKTEFCSPSCRNRYNVYKSRAKSK